MTSLLRKALLPKLGTSSCVLFWTTVAVHLFTVFIAVRLGGLVSGGLSFVFPVAAQVYWILELWQITGQFMNFFTLICLVYLGLWIFPVVKRLQ
jgi:hypothetical protein